MEHSSSILTAQKESCEAHSVARRTGFLCQSDGTAHSLSRPNAGATGALLSTRVVSRLPGREERPVLSVPRPALLAGILRSPERLHLEAQPMKRFLGLIAGLIMLAALEGLRFTKKLD